MILNVSRVNQWFGPKNVLHNVNLKINRGQFVALVGPSGCGKSTLLRSILGTDPPSSGTITTGDKGIEGPTRDVGIVYQHYSLYPFLTVEKNIALGPKLDQTSIPFRTFRPLRWRSMRKKHLEESRELLYEFGLESAAKQYPSKLSGGMRQRVAIAQALIMKPSILLLDEPFGALDEATREELQQMLLRLYQENINAKKEGKTPPHTCIFVTHELNEAFYLADRVVGLSQYWKKTTTWGYGTGGLGATVIYDKAAPVYGPDDPRDFGRFLGLKDLLRQTVFNENNEQDPDEHVTFWSDLANGESTGVSSMRDVNGDDADA